MSQNEMKLVKLFKNLITNAEGIDSEDEYIAVKQDTIDEIQKVILFTETNELAVNYR